MLGFGDFGILKLGFGDSYPPPPPTLTLARPLPQSTRRTIPDHVVWIFILYRDLRMDVLYLPDEHIIG